MLLTVFHPWVSCPLGNSSICWIPMKQILGGPFFLMIEVKRERERILRVPQQSINNGDEFHRGKEGIDENRTLIARKHLICFSKDFGICQNIWLQKLPQRIAIFRKRRLDRTLGHEGIFSAKPQGTTGGSVFPLSSIVSQSPWSV